MRRRSNTRISLIAPPPPRPRALCLRRPPPAFSVPDSRCIALSQLKISTRRTLEPFSEAFGWTLESTTFRLSNGWYKRAELTVSNGTGFSDHWFGFHDLCQINPSLVKPGVAMKYRRSKPHVAATAIQAAYRGHLVRRTEPLKHLRVIRNVRIELQRLEHQLATDPRLFETLRRDSTERLKWSEGGMHLLLQLDSLQGLHPVVRDNRKSLTKEVISYQEYIDSAGKAAHVPHVQPSGQTPPQVVNPQAQGYQYSTTSSATGVDTYGRSQSYGSTQQGVDTYGRSQSYGSTQQGVNPQAHVQYVPTVPGRGERPFAPPPNQYAAQPEKTFYPPQGVSRYEYDARFPPGTDPEIIDLFRKADIDGSGAIDTKELQRILSLKFFNFSRRTVRLMLHLFADDTTISSRLGPDSFAKLWRELKKWQRTFKSFDNDGSGSIDLPELREAMLSLGIGVTPQVLQLLVFNYDRTGLNSSIAFGDFIECGMIVKGLTEKFILHDPQYTGAAKIDYHAFMMMVLPFIVA